MTVLPAILQVVQIAFYSVAIFGVVISWKTLQANRAIKHAEWITSLHEKFYEKDTYREVRGWMDFETLDAKLKDDKNGENQEKLSVYLNFFEFIVTLEKMRQLTVEEINRLFAYYFKSLSKTPIVMSYISRYGYKNLWNFLQRYYPDD